MTHNNESDSCFLVLPPTHIRSLAIYKRFNDALKTSLGCNFAENVES